MVLKIAGWFAQVGPRHAPWRRHQGTAEGRTRWLRLGAVLETVRAQREEFMKWHRAGFVASLGHDSRSRVRKVFFLRVVGAEATPAMISNNAAR
eukprot:4038211-Pyramimonas_sp.AAC.1